MKYNILRYGLLWLLLFFSCKHTLGQQQYRFHSHNDYQQQFPFWTAYTNGAASIEADVFLKEGTLYVTHSENEIREDHTLKSLYLDPISKLVKEENLRALQLLIDLKSPSLPTMEKLLHDLREYPILRKSTQLKIVISGNRPPLETYRDYPDYIYFDHQDLETVDNLASDKITLVSLPFKTFSKWNGLGRLTRADKERIQAVIQKVHKSGLPLRFWGAPDTRTTWSRFAKMGVDFINTDDPARASLHLGNLEKRTFSPHKQYPVYHPEFTYEKEAKPKNIILMIGDGNGLGQISAAMIANGGELNLTQLKNIGLVKTSSEDDWVTDSAAGATAMATGNKTNNRAIGVSPKGKAFKNITEILSEKGFLNGIITTDKITGATPSAFFAHVAERDSSKVILKDLAESSINFFVSDETPGTENKLEKFTKSTSSEFNGSLQSKAILLPEDENPKVKKDEFTNTVSKVLDLLGKQENPFFLMIEAAKIDSYGHENNVGAMIEEMHNFDRSIAEALKAADKSKNTLVIITADHETSGFGILQGDKDSNELEGSFLTHDHTATMVPVFAYGPQSQEFTGVFENTHIFNLILQSLELKEVNR